jgi:outer membrane protein assembly factor BamD (BamD/ComL family)
MSAKPQPMLRKQSAPVGKKLSQGITTALAPRMKTEAMTKSTEKNARLPEQWLKKIDELIKEGKLDEARESIEKFRKRYPDYSLDKRFFDLISTSDEN